jgi:leucyl-tRNA synthetase
MGIFGDTAEVMREHGRDPGGQFDEPFLLLRNQGQILGEERSGDHVVIDGEWRDERLIATSIRVDPGAVPGAGMVVGELKRRTENLLQVETESGLVGVEVPDSATIQIPGIPGANTVDQLRHHLDVQRMSKSRGNVVNPDDLVAEYGADTVRTHLMFAFEWQKGGPWDSRGIVGSHRFIEDVWKLGTTGYEAGEVDESASATLRRRVHQTIAKVDEDMLDFKWNTAVAALMTLRNDMQDALRAGGVSQEAWTEAFETLLKLLAPIAPHVTEELWQRLGHDESIHLQNWPVADPEIAREETVTMVLQVNGKVRDRVEVAVDISAEEAERIALASERVAAWTDGKSVRKVVARPPKLVNVVVG